MITSTKNAAVSLVRGLLSKPRLRNKEGLFVAEGTRLVFDIINSGNVPRTVYITEDVLKKEKSKLSEAIEIVLVAEHVMEAMSDTSTPQGMIGLFEISKYSEADLFKGKTPLILILEELRDPGNMGTIFRTFEAAGGDGIVLLGNCTDPLSPKCVRSTMGSVARLPFIKCKDVESLKGLLSKYENLNVFAAHMDGSPYWEEDFSKGVAFVIGNEANGISDETMALVNRRVSIPMLGKVESLNAATSAALLSFEVARQRK